MNDGKPQMIRFASAILEGMFAYQTMMARLLLVFALVFFGAIVGILFNDVHLACPPITLDDPQFSTNTCNPFIGTPDLTTVGIFTGLCFLTGALLAAATAFISTHISTKANVRTTWACSTSTQDGARVALKSGALVGLATSSLALMGLVICIMVLTIGTYDQRLVWQYLVGFGFGASVCAMFVRVAGGAYAKSAAMGIDLADKMNVAPAGSSHNPGVVAALVGGLVSELSGSALGFFESWIGSIIAAAILGFSTYSNLDLTPPEMVCLFGAPSLPAYTVQTKFAISAIAYPLWLAGVQIICTMFAMQWVRFAVGETDAVRRQEFYLTWSVRGGVYVSNMIYAGLSALVSWICFGTSGEEWKLYGCCLIGMAGALLTGIWHGLMGDKDLMPNRAVQEAADKGPVSFVVEGAAVAGFANMFPMLIIVIVLIACNAIGGQYGVAIAAVSVHAAHAIRVAALVVAPMLETATKIGELCVADVKPEAQGRIDVLLQAARNNSAGNKAVAVLASSLSAVVLTFSFVVNTGAFVVNFDDPVVLAAGFIGAYLPFLMVALQLLPLGPMAEFVFLDIKKKVEANPQLKDNAFAGDSLPDVQSLSGALQTRAALNLITPMVVLLATPFVVAFMLGSRAHSATLFAAIVTGTFLALHLGQSGSMAATARYQLARTSAGEARVRAADMGFSLVDPLTDTIAPLVITFVRSLVIFSLLLAPVFRMVNPAGTQFNDSSWWMGICVLGGSVLGLFFFHYLGAMPFKEKQSSEFAAAVAALGIK